MAKPKDVWGLPIPSASDVVSFLNNAVNVGRLASGDKQAMTPGDAGVRTMGRGISMTNDYLNPYANTTKQLLGMAAGNPDAEAKFAKSLARDVAITGAAVGVGSIVAPKAKALMEWIKPKDIGIHLSPINDIKTVLPNINSNRGARETFNFPLAKDQTYKLSSVDVNKVKMKPSVLVDSAEEYSGAFAGSGDSKGFINAYVTRSKIGKPDPEVVSSIGKKYIYGNQKVATNGPNSRITPKQDVVGSVKVWSPSDFEDPLGYFPENQKEKLVKIIQLEKKKELARSVAKGSAVGGAAIIPTGAIVKNKYKK